MSNSSEDQNPDPSKLDRIARKYCEKLLTSQAAQRDPKGTEALIILAFTYGAAWALDRPDMIELGDAMADANRSVQQ